MLLEARVARLPADHAGADGGDGAEHDGREPRHGGDRRTERAKGVEREHLAVRVCDGTRSGVDTLQPAVEPGPRFATWAVEARVNAIAWRREHRLGDRSQDRFALALVGVHPGKPAGALVETLENALPEIRHHYGAHERVVAGEDSEVLQERIDMALLERIEAQKAFGVGGEQLQGRAMTSTEKLPLVGDEVVLEKSERTVLNRSIVARRYLAASQLDAGIQSGAKSR